MSVCLYARTTRVLMHLQNFASLSTKSKGVTGFTIKNAGVIGFIEEVAPKAENTKKFDVSSSSDKKKRKNITLRALINYKQFLK